jgi:hypothetical protein
MIAVIGDTFSGIVSLPDPKSSSGFTQTRVTGTFVSGCGFVLVGLGSREAVLVSGVENPSGSYINPHTGEVVMAYVPTSRSTTLVSDSMFVVEGDTVVSKYTGVLVVDKTTNSSILVS